MPRPLARFFSSSEILLAFALAALLGLATPAFADDCSSLHFSGQTTGQGPSSTSSTYSLTAGDQINVVATFSGGATFIQINYNGPGGLNTFSPHIYSSQSHSATFTIPTTGSYSFYGYDGAPGDPGTISFQMSCGPGAPTPAPSISSVNPTTGVTTGGQTVTLSGSGFTSVSGVSFGGTAAASYSTASSSEITAITPSHAAGTVDITVTTAGGTSSAGASDKFTFGAVPGVSNSSATVAYDAAATNVSASISNSPTSVSVSTSPAHGTASISGTTVKYTPTTGYFGSDSLSYTATNTYGTSTAATVSITVTPPSISVSPTSLPAGTAGVAYSQSLTASGGKSPYTLNTTLASGALPTGLSLASNGTISGTPTAHGTFTFTVSGHDSSTNTNATFTSSTISLTIALAAPVAGNVTTTVAYDSSSNPITLNLSGGAAASVAIATGAAHGTATASGTSITYTPTTGYFGPDSFTYTATNTTGTSTAATVSVSVSPPSITVTPVTLPMATVNSAYSLSLTASGGLGPYTFNTTLASGALPAGLSLASNGTISGTPTASGSFTFTVSGHDSSTPTNAAFTSGVISLTVKIQAPVAGATSATVAYDSTNNPITLNLSGGTATSVTVASSASHGVPIATGTTITYTPTSGYFGSDSFTYTATNSTGTSTAATVTITVTGPTITIAPATLPTATVGSSYSYSLTGSGGQQPYVFNTTLASGALPSGLTLAANGAISGTPASSGTFTFTVSGHDSSTATNANFTSGTISLDVKIQAPVTASSNASVAYDSTANNIPLLLSGGTAASVAIVTPPAHGTPTISGTSIAYTPTTGYFGPDSFTYTASNTTGTSSAATVGVTVGGPTILVTPTTLPGGTQYAAYSQSISASGGQMPYTFMIASGALPAGLFLAANGNISGTPTASGLFTFTVSGHDSSTATAANFTSGTISLNIGIGVPVAGAANATVAYDSTANNITLNLSGGVPASVAVASPASHGTATASGTSITYTPATGYFGTDSFTYTAANTTGASSAATVSVTVSAPSITVTPTTLATGTLGTAYSASLAANGGQTPYTFSTTLASGALPAGLTLLANGTISGTPTGVCTCTFTVTGTDSSTSTPATFTSATIHLTVGAPVPTITHLSVSQGPLAGGTTVTITGTGFFGATATHFGATSATLSSVTANTVMVTSPPSTAGVVHVTLTTPGGTSTTTAADQFTYVAAPSVTAGQTAITLTQNHAATPFSPATATGGLTPLVYSVAPTLPAGLALDSSTGIISGTPSTPQAVTSYTLTVTDAGSQHNSTGFTVGISTAVTATQQVSSVSLTASHAATSFTPVAGGGGLAPLTYSVTPALPAGLTFSTANGLISGTPSSASAATSYSVTVTDANGATASASFTLTVNGSLSATQAISSSNLTATQAVTSFTPVTGSGGTSPLSYGVSPALPAGLSLSTTNGAITGTPTSASASTTYTVTVTDANGATASAMFSLTVNATLSATTTIANNQLTENQMATPFTPVTSSGGTTPLGFAITPALPTGLNFSSTTGAISGTPTAAIATTAFTVTVTDANGVVASASFNLIVQPAPTGTPLTSNTISGAAVLFHVTAAATGAPFTGVAITQAPSSGTAIVDGLDILYIPDYTLTTAQTVTFSYTITNIFGTSSPQQISVTVTPGTQGISTLRLPAPLFGRTTWSIEGGAE